MTTQATEMSLDAKQVWISKAEQGLAFAKKVIAELILASDQIGQKPSPNLHALTGFSLALVVSILTCIATFILTSTPITFWPFIVSFLGIISFSIFGASAFVLKQRNKQEVFEQNMRSQSAILNQKIEDVQKVFKLFFSQIDEQRALVASEIEVYEKMIFSPYSNTEGASEARAAKVDILDKQAETIIKDIEKLENLKENYSITRQKFLMAITQYTMERDYLPHQRPASNFKPDSISATEGLIVRSQPRLSHAEDSDTRVLEARRNEDESLTENDEEKRSKSERAAAELRLKQNAAKKAQRNH